MINRKIVIDVPEKILLAEKIDEAKSVFKTNLFILTERTVKNLVLKKG